VPKSIRIRVLFPKNLVPDQRARIATDLVTVDDHVIRLRSHAMTRAVDFTRRFRIDDIARPTTILSHGRRVVPDLGRGSLLASNVARAADAATPILVKSIFFTSTSPWVSGTCLQHWNSNLDRKELGAYCCVCAGIAVITIGVEMSRDLKSPLHRPVSIPRSRAIAARRSEPGVWAVLLSNCERLTTRMGANLLMTSGCSLRNRTNRRASRALPAACPVWLENRGCERRSRYGWR
jgi:hypothetical protein